jgi:hypothetical protein
VNAVDLILVVPLVLLSIAVACLVGAVWSWAADGRRRRGDAERRARAWERIAAASHEVADGRKDIADAARECADAWRNAEAAATAVADQWETEARQWRERVADVAGRTN